MSKKPCVLALGMFDSVHIGHKKIIESCVSYAKQNGVLSVVFTFDKDVSSVINGGNGKNSSVYSPEERISVIKSLGVDEVFTASTDSAFLSKSKQEFLKYLDEFYDIKGYFCGFDYRFGNKASGDVDFLKNYAESLGRFVCVTQEVTDGNKKVSTSDIKKLLANGKVEKVSEYLPKGYFITGTVVKDRGVGKKLGFPTANLYPDLSKLPLKNAVYGGRVVLDKTYFAVINYGARPTFGLDKPLVEVHLIGFDGDLYGKKITVYFDKFLREIKTFDSEEQLIEQLEKDIGEYK